MPALWTVAYLTSCLSQSPAKEVLNSLFTRYSIRHHNVLQLFIPLEELDCTLKEGLRKCSFCKKSAHARTSRYLSENVKQRYHQCMNIECSATFRTLESIDGVIRSPATEPVIPVPAPATTVNRAGA